MTYQLADEMKHRSYHLELLKDDFIQYESSGFEGSQIVCLSKIDFERCRYLWEKVGEGFWSERSDWSSKDWNDHLERRDVAFFVYSSEGDDCGFFELSRVGKEVKIEGFGLLEEFRGRGLGVPFLSKAVVRAFDWDAERLWLHTATDDHPNALPTYEKVGFQIYREEELKEPMPTRHLS